jgi:hypothetical protein
MNGSNLVNRSKCLSVDKAVVGSAPQPSPVLSRSQKMHDGTDSKVQGPDGGDSVSDDSDGATADIPRLPLNKRKCQL